MSNSTTTVEMKDILLFTNSSMACFKTCRKMAYFAYIRRLEKNDAVDVPLTVGTALHKAIELHFTLAKKSMVDVDACVKLAKNHVEYNQDQAKIKSMVGNYCRVYSDDMNKYEVVKLEYEFMSSLFKLNGVDCAFGGKIDGLLREKATGHYYLIEHKTTSRIDNGYLSSLWMNTQIVLYSVMLESLLNIKIYGVIYDIIEKPQISIKTGESEQEFNERLDAAKNKKLVKRKMPESIEDFEERCNELYRDGSRLKREVILLSDWEKSKTMAEAYLVASDWVRASSGGEMYRNTGSCFKWNKPCKFLPICQSNENEGIIESLYRMRSENHAELGGLETDNQDLAF